MNLAQQKETLRRQVGRQTETLSEEYLRQSDEAILSLLCAEAALQKAKVVFSYVSVGREPDTRRFIEALLAEGKTVCVPRCHRGGVMHSCSITGFAQLLPARYGLLEPAAETPITDPAQIELVVAPCVAADRRGGRLGHGAGYYDRFLTKTTCPVFCLCRGVLLQQEIPMGPYDRRMDLVITEAGVFP
ncbi:5-formyltetrahydrofolate cyclo-ligase [Ruminococcaceae bacterium OttesenSCG-928-I18]|nr:5-formyltetrahydrofolate cyclo-ligase [Ruminococcaceae bacterium OttesenSCG-928-I18]